jgi:O-antigen/teichoic acid export membrane protein
MGGAAGTAAGASDRATSAVATTRSFVRGSSLLLVGRALSLGLNFGAQVMIVRYLSKADYGAFAYALGVASMAAVAVLLGLQKAIPRFLPIYREREDYRRMFGAVALGGLTVAGLGVSVALLTHGLQGLLLVRAVSDPLALSLLLVLIVLTPIEALDHLLQGLLATFAGARALFFRRHVLAPALRIAAVALVIATAGDVRLLAWGYVVGGAIPRSHPSRPSWPGHGHGLALALLLNCLARADDGCTGDRP